MLLMYILKTDLVVNNMEPQRLGTLNDSPPAERKSGLCALIKSLLAKGNGRTSFIYGALTVAVGGMTSAACLTTVSLHLETVLEQDNQLVLSMFILLAPLAYTLIASHVDCNLACIALACTLH